MELITFGILSGESELSVEDTITVSAIRSVVKRIPSANDAEGFQWAVMDLDENTSIKKRKKLVPRSRSAPATLLAKTVSEAMMAREALSPQREEEEEEEFDDSETEDEFVNTVAKTKTHHSQSMSALPEVSDQNCSAATLSPSVSKTEEQDDSLLVSTEVIVNIDLSNLDTKVPEQKKTVRTKEPALARKESSKASGEKPPTGHYKVGQEKKGRENIKSSSDQRENVKKYTDKFVCSSAKVSTTVSSKQSQKRPESSSVFRANQSKDYKPTSLSSRSVSDTQKSNTNSSFDISEIDTAESNTIQGIGSFDSTGAFYEDSKREARMVPLNVPSSLTAVTPPRNTTTSVPPIRNGTTPPHSDATARRLARWSATIQKLEETREHTTTSSGSTTPDSTVRRAARRSARIQKLEDKKEQTKIAHLTQSLLFMRSASEESKSEQTKSSGASSSTGNHAIASSAEQSLASGIRTRRRKNSSDSFDSIRGLFENNKQSQLPKYVSTGTTARTPERRTRRSQSNKSQANDSLRAIDSAQ
jgi:hypothetical protein